MKKFVLLIIVIAALLQFSGVSAAESDLVLIHQDDFSRLSVGDDYITKGSYKMGTQTGAITIQNDGDGNYLLCDGSRMPDGYNSHTGYSSPNLGNNPITTIKFDYKIMGSGEGTHFYCGDTINMELDATPLGYANNEEGKAETYYPTFHISTGVWHEITAIINLDRQKYDLYVDDIRIVGDGKFRKQSQTTIGKANFYINSGSYKTKIFGLRNIKVYEGDVRPEYKSDYAAALSALPEKKLISFTEHTNALKQTLSSAYAVFEGYPIAFSAGNYEFVSEDAALAPVLYDGCVYAPADYVAKALGGTYSDGTVSVGDNSYLFVEGETSELCTNSPIKVGDELYIPITNELASYFGSEAYVDERGLAIIGMSETPGEAVIKSLLFELRNRASVFGSGIKSNILFSTRNMQLNRPDVKAGYDSLDAAKRFMSTFNVWTYLENTADINKFEELGNLVQSGLNARPVTVEKDENGDDVKFTANGKTYLKYVAASIDFDGNIRLRPSDGLDGWGCTNNPVFFDDLLQKAKIGIDKGQYVWQFDDHALNAGYGCYCDYCMDGFEKWLTEEKNFRTYRDLYDNYDAGNVVKQSVSTSNKILYTEYNISNYEEGKQKNWAYYEYKQSSTFWGSSYNSDAYLEYKDILNTDISEFDYKTYLKDVEGITTATDATTYYTSKTRMGKAYYEFSAQKAKEFHLRLRNEIDAYAAQKGLKIYMSHNTSNPTNDLRGAAWIVDIMDGCMSEINPKYTQPDGVFVLRLSEQAFGSPHISSLWVNQGKTSMQLWESVVPLMCATGQQTLIPWDSWVYNSTRYYCTTDELAKNYSFIREYPYLFDYYEAPEEIGYIVDMDNDGFSNTYLRRMALALGKKGMASKFIASRDTDTPNYAVDSQDLIGLKALVNVNGVILNSSEAQAISDAGLAAVDYTFDSDKATELQSWESDYWTARIKDIPEKTFAVLRKNTLYKDAPVVVHAVSFETFVQNNVDVEINNKYLPFGDSFTVKIYSPGKNPYTIPVSKSSGGITTVTIPELDNWAILEIFGVDNQNNARFSVDNMSGIGLGSRVSYDSATGTQNDFIITTYGEGINVYTAGDDTSGQDEAGFVYKHINADDYEIVAKVSQIVGESGIMIREDVYSNAAAVILSYSSEHGLRFGKRDVTNTAYIFKDVADYEQMPEYLKLVVKNSAVTAYVSEDGEIWDNLGCYNIYFNPCVAGVFAASADGTRTTCRVNNLNITTVDHVLENKVDSVNLFEGRNPSFNNTLLLDFSAGYDGIWDSSLEGSTTDKYQADGKTAPDGTTAKVTRVDGGADSYGASVKLTNRANADEGLWYRYLPVENGKVYEISCWAKVDSGVSETGFLHVQTPMVSTEYTTKEYNGTNTFEVLSNERVELSDEWKHVYVRFKISDSGYCQGIDVIFKTLGVSNIYLDNFEMKELHTIGENIYASVVDNGYNAILELSSVDNNTANIRYMSVVKTDEDGAERIASVDIKNIEVTDKTERMEITLGEPGSRTQIYLWDADTNAPINRVFEVRRTK